MGLQMLMELKNAKFWKQKILQGINAYKRTLLQILPTFGYMENLIYSVQGRKKRNLLFLFLFYVSSQSSEFFTFLQFKEPGQAKFLLFFCFSSFHLLLAQQVMLMLHFFSPLLVIIWTGVWFRKAFTIFRSSLEPINS